MNHCGGVPEVLRELGGRLGARRRAEFSRDKNLTLARKRYGHYKDGPGGRKSGGGGAPPPRERERQAVPPENTGGTPGVRRPPDSPGGRQNRGGTPDSSGEHQTVPENARATDDTAVTESSSWTSRGRLMTAGAAPGSGWPPLRRRGGGGGPRRRRRGPRGRRGARAAGVRGAPPGLPRGPWARRSGRPGVPGAPPPRGECSRVRKGRPRPGLRRSAQTQEGAPAAKRGR